MAERGSPEIVTGGAKGAAPSADSIRLRKPRLPDAEVMRELVAVCEELDLNSCYTYLLLCEHFRDTCVVSEKHDSVVAFMSGYRLPKRPDTLFVWQIAVHPDSRRQGVAQRMIEDVFDRDSQMQFIEATATSSNAASMKLFHSLARHRGAPITRSALFGRDLFDSRHEDEFLLRIGPIGNPSPSTVPGASKTVHQEGA